MYEDELKLELSSIVNPSEIISDWEPIADILNELFDWKGSKIDWGRLEYHRSTTLNNSTNDLSLISKFIVNENIEEFISKSNYFFYISDSPLDFCLKLNGDNLYDVIVFCLENIPHHHYFFDPSTGWCLSITFEGIIDFGISEKIINKNMDIF